MHNYASHVFSLHVCKSRLGHMLYICIVYSGHVCPHVLQVFVKCTASVCHVYCTCLSRVIGAATERRGAGAAGESRDGARLLPPRTQTVPQGQGVPGGHNTCGEKVHQERLEQTLCFNNRK